MSEAVLGAVDGFGRIVASSARRWSWLLAIMAVIAYFSAQAMVGRYGWPQRQRLITEVAEARAELARLQAIEAELTAVVGDLRHDALRADALETELRKLGYVRSGELIVFDD